MNISHIDHLVIFISNIKNTERFYNVFLGEPLHKDNESLMYKIGETKLFLALPYKQDNNYDKDRVGLNHIAFYVEHKELAQFRDLLTQASIKHGGILKDKYSGNDFIWFDDPDGIRLEFYSRNVE